MNKPLIALFLSALALGCKSKKENVDGEVDFFPALSFIKSQVAHVDTSVYRIIKIVKKDNITDTFFLRREDFRTAAGDFLSLPDISSGDLKDEYVETKLYDESLGQIVLNYMPKEQDAELTRQEVMIQPGPEGDKVKSFFVNRVIDSDDSTVQKILFWEVDKRFKIVTTVEKINTPEKTETVEVVWNDFLRQ